MNERQKFRKRPFTHFPNNDASSNQSSLVDCSFCHHEMDEPKTLLCGHNLCASCAEMKTWFKHLLANDLKNGCNHEIMISDITCRECQLVTSVPPGGLPTNALLKGLIEQMKKAQGGSGSCCSSCKQSRQQLYVCTDCKGKAGSERLCADCVLKSHRRHQTHPVGELISAEEVEQIGRESRAIYRDFERDCQRARNNAMSEIEKVFTAQRAKLGNTIDEVKALCEGQRDGFLLKSDVEKSFAKAKTTSAAEKTKLADFSTNLSNLVAKYAKEARKGN